MRLKCLELIGFKSFAQKVNLEFPAGITGIVGPNGSGKSNIIDAVRWILGEREAKNLRGAKAEDLIFAGTHQRAKTGLAQATLNFDNSSGFFPVDFSEVSITRRIDRSGLSQYFLNKSEVRLKDIIDFFAKARLGTKGLTIINQGESDLFVKASPLERKEMIEEILGLRQYQLKKHEAERKLKNTVINTEKVKAMVDEIAPHLRFLRKQTAKWEKLSQTEKELRDFEDIYFKNKLKEIKEGSVHFDLKIRDIDKKILQKKLELKELESALSKVENNQPQKNNQLSEIHKKRAELFLQRSALEKELGKLEAKLEMISLSGTDKSENAAALVKEVKLAIEKIVLEEDFGIVKNLLNSLLVKLEKFLKGGDEENSKEFIDLKKSKDEFLIKVEKISVELRLLDKSETQSAASLENFNVEFRKAFENVEAKKDEITLLENEKNKIFFETEKYKLRLDDLKTQISQSARSIDEFEDFKNAPEIDDLLGLERKIFRLRAEIAGIGEIDEALLKEANETEVRHNFLSLQLGDLEKAVGDLNNLIKELDAKIHHDFTVALKQINEEFDKFFQLMFSGGKAKLVMEKPQEKIITEEQIQNKEGEEIVEEEDLEERQELGIRIELSLPRKKIKGLDMLSGGEKSLVSIAALFALISVSPPPFLVLDEIDAALDENNTRRFAELIKDFSKKTQFVIVTHNRATMEVADVLYGITMEEAGVSKILSLKLEV